MSSKSPELSLRLYGETRATPTGLDVTAGPLSFRLDGMALRWIRWNGTELLRAISFVVRDPDWGTYEPSVHIEADERTADRASLRLAATITQGTATLDCRLDVSADADGLALSASATAHGRFMTNRTGFVVLHPASCAGRAIHVDHTDGTTSSGTFPALISPHQPFFDITAIEHEPAAGIAVRIALSGEVFEMEDQRNWSDASFKTYSRPLSRPYPYAIEDGETATQSVRLVVRTGPAAKPTRRAAVPRIEVGAATADRLPRLGLGGRIGEYRGTAAQRARLAALRPALLLAELGADTPDPAGLDVYRDALAATGASSAVMLRPGADGLGALDAVLRAGIRPDALALVTADPTTVERTRRALPGARIGTGTDAFFTEFNRIPPSPADFQFWTVNPTVHATDDASVMETLAVLPDQVTTARARFPDAALWCGPVTLRMRFNPNATGPAAPVPPGEPPADVDARQRGLFAAAFTLGHIAAWSRAGIDTLILHAPFGPRGMIHAGAGFPLPWYDDQPDGVVYPVYHVLAGLAGQSGSTLREVRTSTPEQVVALATDDTLWVGNITPASVELGVQAARARLLDADSFADAVCRPDSFWDRKPIALSSGRLRLGPYAVARLPLH